jgi:hypothetical protein
MKLRNSSSISLGLLATLLWLLAFAVKAEAKDLQFQAYLVWAADAQKSPDPTHKPVDPEVRRKLHELPLKWANFFEVSRVSLTVAEGKSGTTSLSDHCRVEVTDVNGKNVEVSLIGKGAPVLKRIQPLPKGEMLVLGGNAPDSTGWLVVLKRTE